MTGKEALGALIVDKKPIRRQCWPVGDHISSVNTVSGEVIFVSGLSGKPKLQNISAFLWHHEDWEVQQPRETCSFVELFDKLNLGDYAIIACNPEVQYFFNQASKALVYRTSPSHEEGWPVVCLPNVVKATFIIYRKGTI